MQLLRKFYMADAPGGSTGPNREGIDSANESLKNMQNELRGIDAIFKHEINRSIEGMDDRTKAVAKSIGRDLSNAVKDSIKLTKNLKDSTNDIGKSLNTEAKIREELTKVETRRESIAEHLNELVLEGVQITGEMQRAADDLTNTLASQNTLLEIRLQNVIKTEKAMGVLGKTVAGLSKIPILGSLFNAEKVLDKMKTTASETGSKFQAMLTGVKEIGKGIAENLTDPFVLLGGLFTGLIAATKTIIKLATSFDQKTFDIAKNLGVTVDEAAILQKQFVDLANSSTNFGLRSSEIAKSYAEISNSLGFLAPTNREFAETATLIQKRLGASAEDMSALALQSTLSGKTLEETMGTLNASRNIEGARNKLLLSQKQILDGISKVSSAVLINFKGNVTELGNAIVRATKLGTTLDTVNKQGESLLDFESSISKEFEAQLLTGRDINLTRAREFALAGDTKNLMEELNRQGATYQQFMSENVIARRAEAAAVGLSVDEYSKILLKQQQANRLGAQQGRNALEQYNYLVEHGATQSDIIRKLGSEQEAADLRRASMQDKFQAAIERLQDTLGQIVAGPMAQVITDITTFLSKSENVKSVIGGVKTLFQGIASVIKALPQILEGVLFVAKALASIAIANAVANVTAASAWQGPLAIAAGVATAAYLNSLLPGGGISGAGEAETMTPPVNPATATIAAQTNQTTAQQQQPAPVYTFHHVTKVGEKPTGKVT